MPITVVATAGAANANSYVDVTSADTYLNTRLNADAWNTVTDPDTKARAVIEASREMTLLEGAWVGQRSTSTQSLSWPRQFAIDPDKPQIIGVVDIAQLYFPITVVPQRVMDATCELALEFLRAGSTDIAGHDKKLDVMEKTTDVLRTSYAKPWERAQGLARFDRVLKLITPILDAAQTGGMQVVRV